MQLDVRTLKFQVSAELLAHSQVQWMQRHNNYGERLMQTQMAGYVTEQDSDGQIIADYVTDQGLK